MKGKIISLLFILSLFTQISAQSFFKQAESEKVDERPDRHLFWGHYKPNRLSVVTQRSRSPLSIGFMYSDDVPIGAPYEDFEKLLRDKVGPSNTNSSTEYLAHDGSEFSLQRITDKALNLQFEVTFFKTKPEAITQQSWVYYIESKANSKADSEKLFNSYVYLSGESLDGRGLNTFELIEKGTNRWRFIAYDMNSNSFKGYFDLEFIPRKPISDSLIPDDPDITEEEIAHYRNMWKLQNPGVYVEEEKFIKKPEITLCHFDVPPSKVWRHSKYIFNAFVDDQEAGVMKFDEKECKAKESKFSLAVLQIRGYPGYKIKVTHQSVSKPVHISDAAIKLNVKYYMDKFNDKLGELFPVIGAPDFEAQELRQSVRRAAISNLFAGLSYSHGRVKTLADMTSSKPTQNEYDLFTSTPSRSHFPRGFLWDEGFHLLLTCRWDKVLCMEIIKSWFSTMTVSGWIPREQSRGEEQESWLSGNKFLYQSELEANPPTILFGLGVLMSGVNQSHPDYNTVLDFLNSGIEGKVFRWFKYFNSTQRNFLADNHSFKTPLFKWACPEPCEGKTPLGSGLDDYPRTNGMDEPLANLDLQVWMISMVKILNSIARFKGAAPKPSLVELEKQLLATLPEFYDVKDNLYKDLTQNPMGTDYGTLEKKFSEHLGYVNLFPMFFGLVPPKSPAIKKILALLKEPEHLWSEFGIRSLSVSDSSFMQGSKYWTEPVWININYMILRSLKLYYSEEPGAAELYEKLRENVIKVVTANWSRTGTFWENYSSITGKGQKAPGFTGWSSLVVLIMSEIY